LTLLVVALLLAPSLNDALIKDFTVLCKKEDSNHITVANARIVPRMMSRSLTSDGSFISFIGNGVKDLVAGGHTDLGKHYTDAQGKIAEKHNDYDDGRAVMMYIDYPCVAP
ncbi:hypothetical protein PENTCL1PPCAC_5521, partial [Pristionchus entomophagus]